MYIFVNRKHESETRGDANDEILSLLAVTISIAPAMADHHDQVFSLELADSELPASPEHEMLPGTPSLARFYTESFRSVNTVDG